MGCASQSLPEKLCSLLLECPDSRDWMLCSWEEWSCHMGICCCKPCARLSYCNLFIPRIHKSLLCEVTNPGLIWSCQGSSATSSLLDSCDWENWEGEGSGLLQMSSGCVKLPSVELLLLLQDIPWLYQDIPWLPACCQCLLCYSQV